MITVRTMKNAETAKEYFAKHLGRSEYYLEGSQVEVRWFGKGCNGLGLEPGSAVSQEAFERLCDNLHPLTGEPLTARHRTSDRRVGFDAVTSSLKSVSIMALVAGDSRLIDLHNTSARVAMSRLEQYAATRIRKGHRDDDRRTGEMLVASVTHGASRALDPQLHSHFVVFNATWDPVEGRWKALQTREMFEQIALCTEIYRSELAAGLKALGYTLRPTANCFEIDGVPEELLQRFSKRRRAILDAEAIVSDKIGGPLSNNARATLAQTTRDWKDMDQSPEEILRYQRSQMTEDELAALQRLIPGENPAPSDVAVSPRHIIKPPSVSPAAAVDYARDHLFERKSVVPVYALLKEAMAYGHGDLKIEDIEEELAQRSEFVEFEDSVTTHEMIRLEQEMLSLVNSGTGKFAPINPTARSESPLNREQKVAFRAVMDSPDWVIGIRGVAGSGKTELLRGIAGGVEQAERKAVVLAPTSAACDALRSRGLTWSSTVQNFLANPDFQRDSKGAVVMVDEAGLLSVGDMLQLLKVARDGNSRVVLCGDTRQHTGIEAGDALRLLEERSAMQSAGLVRNTRQTNREYREAIEAFASGNGVLGLSRLDAIGAVHEVNEENRNEALVAGYLKSVNRGKSALIVSPTWREILGITADVRTALKANGGLGATEDQVEVHSSLNWTRAQKRDLRNYREGMVLHFHRGAAEVYRGESLRVLRTQGNAILARKADSTEVKLTGKQADCFDVLQVGKLPVAAGEVLQLKGNLKSHGLINGKCVKVSAVRADGGLELVDGRTIPPTFRTFTHGYCITSVAAQGRTADHVYVAVGSDSLVAASLNQFYVSASRGREQIQVFTDDIETLRSAVRRSGKRLAAVEFSDRIRQHTEHAVRQSAGVTA